MHLSRHIDHMVLPGGSPEHAKRRGLGELRQLGAEAGLGVAKRPAMARGVQQQQVVLVLVLEKGITHLVTWI